MSTRSARHARRYSRTREWWTGRTPVVPKHRRAPGSLEAAFYRLSVALKGAMR